MHVVPRGEKIGLKLDRLGGFCLFCRDLFVLFSFKFITTMRLISHDGIE